jgi:Site-specific recombinases, DNA invertase Pin homologs
MKAAIYLRVSTLDQNVDSQRAETLRFAESRGWDYEVFEDKASGASRSRAGLDAMMERIRRGEFKVLISYKIDRLGRSLPHLAQLIDE